MSQPKKTTEKQMQLRSRTEEVFLAISTLSLLPEPKQANPKSKMGQNPITRNERGHSSQQRDETSVLTERSPGWMFQCSDAICKHRPRLSATTTEIYPANKTESKP